MYSSCKQASKQAKESEDRSGKNNRSCSGSYSEPLQEQDSKDVVISYKKKSNLAELSERKQAFTGGGGGKEAKKQENKKGEFRSRTSIELNSQVNLRNDL